MIRRGIVWLMLAGCANETTVEPANTSDETAALGEHYALIDALISGKVDHSLFAWTDGEWAAALAAKPYGKGHYVGDTFVLSELWHRAADGAAGNITYRVSAGRSGFLATPITGGTAIALQSIDVPLASALAGQGELLSQGAIKNGVLSPAPYYVRYQATKSAIQNVVIVLQENHSFDNYFGDRCQGAPGVSCNAGWDCCESVWGSHAPWTKTATGLSPTELTDDLPGCHDPDHNAPSELGWMHEVGGVFQMDKYPNPTALPCLFGNETSVARYLPGRASVLDTYWSMAEQGALADRYFQPIIGASSSNDMFLFRAGFVHQDNLAVPNDAPGGFCNGYDDGHSVNAPNAKSSGGVLREYADLTVGDFLDKSGVSFSAYIEGYDVAAAIDGKQCPAPSVSNLLEYKYPFFWDADDDPLAYYPQFRNNPQYVRDLSQLDADLAAGTLPRFTLIRSLGIHSEHPIPDPTNALFRTLLSDGQAFVSDVVQKIQADPVYGARTLVIVTWDEGGGFYDHISPPHTLADGSPLPRAAVDAPSATTTDGAARPAARDEPECYLCTTAPQRNGQQDYGTRVPFMALGPFARQGWVSHTVMEHSSIVKFLEWNFLNGKTGQLGTRDAHVNNLGSVLDPKLGVPEGL